MENEKLIESVVILKHKLRQISHYIKDNKIPLSIKLDVFGIENLAEFESKKYLLHTTADFNIGQLAFYNRVVSEEERLKLDFIKPVAGIETPIFLKLHKEGRLD